MKPEQQDLRVGQKYCRFASSTSSREAQLGGGWCLTTRISQRSADLPASRTSTWPYAARLFLALPYAWTRVDGLVSPDKPGANVREGLNAEGIGARRPCSFLRSIAETRTVHFWRNSRHRHANGNCPPWIGNRLWFGGYQASDSIG